MSRKKSDKSPYMTKCEVADYCRVSTATIGRYVKSGELSCRRLAGRGQRLFKIDDVERLLIQESHSSTKDEELEAFIIAKIGR
jgi:excisionase family DNA binding protein